MLYIIVGVGFFIHYYIRIYYHTIVAYTCSRSHKQNRNRKNENTFPRAATSSMHTHTNTSSKLHLKSQQASKRFVLGGIFSEYTTSIKCGEPKHTVWYIYARQYCVRCNQFRKKYTKENKLCCCENIIFLVSPAEKNINTLSLSLIANLLTLKNLKVPNRIDRHILH